MDQPKAPGGSDEAPSPSGLVIGCMKHAVTWRPETAGEAESAADYEKSRAAIQTGLSLGVTKFDHADIYCRGRSEAMFPLILKDLGIRRESLIIQGKCGMVYADDSPQALGKQYDLSYDHIMSAVEGSLRRLGTGYLDVLLLHRPDPWPSRRKLPAPLTVYTPPAPSGGSAFPITIRRGSTSCDATFASRWWSTRWRCTCSKPR
jgi:aryl-alcohol dehydrogenase-like predicted oxidoreductase